MEFEYGLVENALHSLREAMNYYHNGDETVNATQYKFSILLSAHCAELLLKEILRRNHPALLFENIDHVKDLNGDEDMTVNYVTSINRVKTLCKVDLMQYENYLRELGGVRNKIQHYKYQIKGEYHKGLMTRTFSAIEFLFRDVLKLQFEDFEEVINKDDIEFLHEDIASSKARKADIAKEFNNKLALRYQLEYAPNKYIDICCPVCGTESLAVGQSITCKFCGHEFENHTALFVADDNCIMQNNVLRELGRRKHILRSKPCKCPVCHSMTMVELTGGCWSCLICGHKIDDSVSCEECGDSLPNSNSVFHVAISDINPDNFHILCSDCVRKVREREDYIGFEIS